MNNQDKHPGAILTPKSSSWRVTQPSTGTFEEELDTFFRIDSDGDRIFDMLQFARTFFLGRGELFTTYEEIWIQPEDLNEFETLYERKKKEHNSDQVVTCSEFIELEKFIKIAKKNEQPIIFVT